MSAPAWLDPELTTLAFCWRLDRRDGVTIGFTGHDRDLVIDGISYRAAPGMTPSAISVSDGLDVDTLDVEGALTGDAIRDEDLAAGRWDGARLRLFAVDWSDPGAGILHLTRGELGDVSLRDGAFTAEMRGPTAILERPACEQTSPECRASLGDRRCRVDLAARTRVVRIASVDDARTIVLDTSEPVANAYGQGRMLWLDGPNSGLTSLIALSDGATVRLREPPPFAATAGVMVRVTEGCDRALATCRDRFAKRAQLSRRALSAGQRSAHALSGSLTMDERDRIVARARGCVGARFRPFGRSIAHGLDCVGVAGLAFDRSVPADYALRGGDPAQIGALIDAAGPTRIAPAAAGRGDLLLLGIGSGQLHLVVLTGSGFVHADVGLRRVVETPGAPAGRIMAAWRGEA